MWGCLSKLKDKVVSGYRKAKEFAREAYDWAKDKVVRGTAYVCATVKKVDDHYTGRDKFEEAKRLYEKLKVDCRRRDVDYRKAVEAREENINDLMSRMNVVRTRLNDSLFRRFEALMSRFANWEVTESVAEGVFRIKRENRRLTPLSKLMKIDLDHRTIGEKFKGFFTLYFKERKLARESLTAVQQEQRELEAAWKNRMAELSSRYDNVEKMLGEIVKECEGFATVYTRLLDEVEYVVHMAHSMRYVISGAACEGPISLNLLQHGHIEIVRTADILTRIIYEMASQRYLGEDEQGRSVRSKDVARFKDLCVEAEKYRKAA